MRTHEASNIPCALVRSLPSVSGVALRAISIAPSCTKKNRAAIRGDAYQIVPPASRTSTARSSAVISVNTASSRCCARPIGRRYFRNSGSICCLTSLNAG